MAEENEVLESWEDLDNNEVMTEKLKGIRVRDKTDDKPLGPVSVMQEEGSRTQYTPQVRILKRDADTGPNPKTPKAQVPPQKSLKQREAEYQEARLRILGEGYSNNENTNDSASPEKETSRPVKLIQHSEEPKVQILREPRGPDGSHGFNQGR